MPGTTAKVDPLSGGQEIAPRTVGFEKVGDFIKGTYVAKRSVNTQYGPNHVYEVKLALGKWVDKDTKAEVEGKAGEYVVVFGGKNQIDGLFGKARFGQIVGIQLKDLKPTKKGNAFKDFRTVLYEDDPDFMGEDSTMVDTIQAAEEIQ